MDIRIRNISKAVEKEKEEEREVKQRKTTKQVQQQRRFGGSDGDCSVWRAAASTSPNKNKN